MNDDREDDRPSVDANADLILFTPLGIELEDTDKARKLVAIAQENIRNDRAPLDDHVIEDLADDSRITLYSLTGNDDRALSETLSQSGEDHDEDIVRAVTCLDILRKIGAELLIYSISFGGIGVATGVLMRFANTDRLASMLIGNGIAVLANENARAYFISALNPHDEYVPAEQKDRFETFKKYLAHPISTIITSTINGGTVSLTGATDLGTRQILVSITAQLGGLTTYAGQTLLRKCFGGAITIPPRTQEPKDAMIRFYSMAPNTDDGNRPHLIGNIRNVLTRVVGMTLATTTTWFSGLYNLETYCGPGREELLKMQGNFTAEDLNQHCVGGQFTMLFRDWGVTMVGFIGFVVAQPLLNKLANRIFDYFYPPRQPQDDEARIVEMPDSDDETV